MPLVRIDILEGRSAAERRRLLDGVHAALVEAFGIPDDDRTQILSEHASENFDIPPTHSDRYTIVEITAFPGRSQDAKQTLYRVIVQNLGAIGVPASDIMVVMLEPPMENWGIRGGRPASDVDLGYRVDI